MKKRIIIFVTVLMMVVVTISMFFANYNFTSSKKSDVVKDGYVAVFHGGVGELTYSTYIYKIDNGHANYGFEYINTTNTTTHWGSSDWIVKITDDGEFSWTDGAFKIARENNAYSYVTVPGSKKTYTIEEFQGMFIMN